ncbi:MULTISPECIES: SulP family inorganic anion transporter [Citrobacter]|uniref:SulP family inorganic anion transporter n=1 Tax=Citrobacter braakii TaxID=57706 RepID=A0A8I0G2Z6_CITBR|nr:MULTISPECIES: SulP family inorganic anion transporter [Citrobacter]MBD3122369.1 SulP family inorganic anion transporter [Citrobacter braakii]MCK2153164.1 SulP family inorganic anion transporter [Citrobacter braakii]MDM3385370.1 SulP family inorganic anion transporter [Citrobacter sp. Cb011]MDM3423314.1 SulP family inorganic anion transporter [Citrobacter sp. Cb025]MDM3439814.1 SulP family inorganic anion transporter [Citrobacter sp. Cb063]
MFATQPSSVAVAEHATRAVLRQPRLLVRETLAGVVTALALIPEVISFSVIAGVDPKVSLIASVVLCLAMSFLGGRPAMVTAAAGSVALVIGPMVHQHGVQYILPAVVLAGIIQILFGVLGMARLMRFIPTAVMTGFVNALGILIFFAQVPHFWGKSPLIWGLFVLTLLIVLWVPRFIKAIPAPLIAIVLLTVFTVTSGQLLPTVGDEGSMRGGLPGFTQLLVPLNLQTLAIIWPCALSIAFVGLMESLLTARLVDDLTATPSNKNRESAGLGIANILAGFYGGIAGCAMIGQTIVNVEMGKGRSRVSTVAAGLVLLLLVTALSEVMAKIPMSVLAGIMVIVAVKTFNWHSIQPATLRQLPVTETLVMLMTVAATVSTGNLALGVVAGVMTMLILPRIVRGKRAATSETALPDREK